ncbi:DNA polymerase IV [Entomoplasma ellychniae]|uniref:DNA polymerase IV n=1 Tax=Entomoplasma ellychniae TaxID=2114 RepID=A0A8E2QXT7_9MOLU|nr:DNA polymerase IV [Entomoplasma ellychniae]PPE04565.1 DNA polymerase IV [Entomoplasma ellychniae]
MKKEQIILHLDMDAFFASCEQANNPSLKNKPIIVSRYDEKSIVVAASYECRKYGVKAGMPIFKVKQLLKNVEFHIVSSGYDLYEKYSKQIFDIIKSQFTHKVEIYGLDECFIDVSDIWSFYGSVKNLCLAIQAAIYQTTTLTCSIGASFNKMFAKMASDMQKPNGIQIITKQNFKSLIWSMDISNVIGIGHSAQKQIEALKISKVFEFVEIDENLVAKLFGKVGFKIQKALKGEDYSFVDYLSHDIKSISKEKTLTANNKLLVGDEEIKELLFQLTKNVVFKLKENNLKAKTIQLSIKFFEDNKKSKSRKTYSLTLNKHTNDLEIIFANLISKLYEIEKENYVSLIGCGVSQLKEINKIVIQSELEL